MKYLITYMDGEPEVVEADFMQTSKGGIHYEFIMIHPATPECDLTGFEVILTASAENVRNIRRISP